MGVGACAALLGLLLHPFQVRAVRVLEGYWDRWPVTAGLAGVLEEIQRRKQHGLRMKAEAAGPGAVPRRVSADAMRRMAGAPPEHVLLPTALGNALRAGELSAGERYGLTTLSSWPRVHMQTSHRLDASLRSTRDALDAGVNLCWSFLAAALVSVVALADEAKSLWLPAVAFVLSALAYKGAVIAGQAYSGLMHVVYDLHRFDLLEALHLPLPAREDEHETFQQVSGLFAGYRLPDLPYAHGLRSGPDHSDGSADPQHVDGEPA
ncbi:hypothetical protein [Streptomyces sp. NPDC050738]|uniref:hypothetical protein n=1 Tax=Streptomyces sp. NPDC050738 TaxID=3154744 RepID=UPI0034140AFB